MANEIYGFGTADVRRIGRAVRDYEQSPGRRPIAQGDHAATTARCIAFECNADEPDEDMFWEIIQLVYDQGTKTVIKINPPFKMDLIELNS